MHSDTQEEPVMKRTLFIVCMVGFTIFLAAVLLISLICGAPADSKDLGRYLFGAVGISVLLPSGFTFFFISTLDLSKKLEESEKTEEEDNTEETLEDVPVSVLVNALVGKQNLTPEEKEKLSSYIEDL